MRFKTIFASAILLVSGLALGVATEDNLDRSGADPYNTASVQRGAALYVNYCQGCHAMQYLRYNRLAEDLNLSEEQVESLLLWGDQEIGDEMINAMDAQLSEEWFGITPPDLSLTARSRGTDWIYSYMRSFYLTDDGWNNTVLENPSMPHVMWELQGIQRAVTESHTDAEGNELVRVVDLALETPGLLDAAEYDQEIRDLTAFMHYASEPSLLKRKKLGGWVMLFLGVITILSWLLYQEFWKDVKK